MSRMYHENVKSINAFVGCHYDCVYCKPSFQRLAKMQRCPKCRIYKPHFHPERLSVKPPQTEGDQFIFFPSMGDIRFANLFQLREMMRYVQDWDSQFLMQSKDPNRVFHWSIYPGEKPTNLLLGTTIETDLLTFDTPSKYRSYQEISKAPMPRLRALANPLLDIVTVEPILDFSLQGMTSLLESSGAKIVYIGYDNHHCHLPEPALEKTLQLIDRVKDFAEVREKTLHTAWWEAQSYTENDKK